MRARLPDQQGYVERAGVSVYYETFGAGKPAVLLLPTWSIMHSRHWKRRFTPSRDKTEFCLSG